MADHKTDNPFYKSWDELIKMPIDMRVWWYLLIEYDAPNISFKREGKIWHYTNAAGLQGIVTSNRFWSSDIRYMNDPTELKYFLDLFEAEVQSISAGFNQDETQLFDEVSALIDGRKGYGSHKEPPAAIFSTSFCMTGDLLSQWRGYGGFGAGYSIGFDLESFVPDVQMGWLVKMSYDEVAARVVCQRIIEIYRESLKVIGTLKSELSEWCYSAIRFAAVGYKHPAYKEEQEVRLLIRQSEKIDTKSYPNREIKYRTRGVDLIPYLDEGLKIRDDNVDPPKLPITDIIVGPGVMPARAVHTLKRFVEVNGFQGVTVAPSKVPFTP